MMNKFDLNGCYVRPMGRKDLTRVMCWRNHPKIRRYMFTQHEITLDEHSLWFEQASQDETRKLLIFEQNELALGFVQFKTHAVGGLSDWGFYIAPDAPKGSGRKLGQTALAYAFEELGLHKICGQAFDFNDRSINFHRCLGFQQEGVLRDQYFDGKSYHAVIYFGLLRTEWLLILSG